MKKVVSLLIILAIIFTSTTIYASNVTSEAEQMQEEANEMLTSIESQVLDEEGNTAFIYALFILIGISMIFEYFVRNYREEIRTRKDNNKEYKNIRKKLWIVYGIHIIFAIIFAFVVKFIVHLTDIYVYFLLLGTVYVVEIAPLFTFHFKFLDRGGKRKYKCNSIRNANKK